MGKEKPRLEIRFGDGAHSDIRSIWKWNAARYNENQADAYIQFLLNAVLKLSSSPFSGQPLISREGTRFLVVKKSRSRSSFGHVVVYRVSSTTIEILRIFHTAQDWQNENYDA